MTTPLFFDIIVIWTMKGGVDMWKKLWKRLRCKHRHQEPVRTDLIKQDNGHWKTVHIWRCNDCGKIL